MKIHVTDQRTGRSKAMTRAQADYVVRAGRGRYVTRDMLAAEPQDPPPADLPLQEQPPADVQPQAPAPAELPPDEPAFAGVPPEEPVAADAIPKRGKRNAAASE